MKISGLYQKRGWWYYQPPTGTNGTRPSAIALKTRSAEEAIDLAFTLRDQAQLIAAATKDRMSGAIEQYLSEKLALGKHEKIASYKTGKALRQICSEMGDPKLNEITEEAIKEWVLHLRKRKCKLAIRRSTGVGTVRERPKTAVGDATVAAYSRILRGFITWIHEEGRIVRKPMKELPSGRCKKTRKMRFTTLMERDLLLEVVTRPDLAFILHLGFHGGLRFGEILAMEPDWLWFAENGNLGKIRVQETKFWKPKDKEAREVPMSPTLLDFLKSWPVEGRFLLEPRKNIFPDPPKYRYHPRAGFAKHVALCGIPWLTFHDMRHSCASHLIQRGASLAEVAAFLGDELSVVEKHYAGLLPSSHDVAARLG